MRQRQNIFFLLWLSAFSCVPLLGFAQMDGLSFSHLEKPQNFSHSQVNQIVQGPEGYLWFGTADGLDRFDGHNIKPYRSDLLDSTTISPGGILSLAISPDSMVFIGTMEGVLNIYHARQDRFQRFSVPINKSTRYASIWDMVFEGDSIAWLGLERGLAKFDRRTGAFQLWQPSRVNRSLRPIFNDVIYSLSADPQNADRLWLGSRGGLLVFSKKNNSFKLPFEAATSRPFLAVKDFLFEKDSLVWLAGNEGSVIRLARNNQQPGREGWHSKAFHPDPLSNFSSVFLLKKDKHKFWVGCPDKGLGEFDAQTGSFSFLNENPLKKQFRKELTSYCAHLDRDGRLWVGTHEGIFFTDPRQQLYRHYRVASPKAAMLEEAHVIGAVDLANNRLLVVTSPKSRFFIFKKNASKLFAEFDAPFSNTGKGFHAIFKSRSGRIWASSSSGLYRFDEQKKAFVRPPYFAGTPLENWNLYRMAEDSTGNLYVLAGGSAGLVQVSPDSEKVRVFNEANAAHIGFPEIEVLTDISVSPQGQVWLFSETDIFRFDPKTGQFKTFACQNCGQQMLTSKWILSGEVDRYGKVWIGYNSGGLDCFDPTTGEVKNFRTAEGLTGEQVLEIEPGKDGLLWLRANNGLFRLDPTTFEFCDFSEKGGLLKPSPNYKWYASLQVLDNGELFMNGKGKFALFAPPVPAAGSTQPKLQIAFDEILVFNQKKKFEERLDYLNEVQLQPDENFFTLTFAALEFTNPQQVRYRYRLMGNNFFTKNYDESWRETTAGRAVYTKVPPGDYLFQVSARSRDSGWMPQSRSIRICVAPPFYRTWWFLLASMVAVLALLWAGYRWRIGQVREKARIKQQLAEMELKALRSQMNPHFLFNSLNSIKNYIVRNEPRTAARYLTKFSQLMRLILSNSKDPTVTLADELKALRLYVELENLRFRKQFKYNFEVAENLPLESIEIPPLVLQPYVENAIWHGLMHKKSGGQLWMRAYRQNGSLHIEIEDNGIGRARAKKLRSKSVIKKKSLGMKITSDRLSLAMSVNGQKASVQINDLMDAKNHAAGTLVHIKIPLKNGNR